MYKFAQFSVRYPTTVVMVVLAILLLGYISFTRLGVDLLPDLNNPRLFVEIEAGERPPEEMENLFVEQMESVAARGRKVVNVSSISRVGKAQIAVEYSWDADMDESFLDLQKAVADFSQNSDADKVRVSQYDPNAMPIVVAVLSHPEITDLNELRKTAENNIRNELIRLPGVASAELVGQREREIEIKTDPYTLEAYGITIEQIANAIQSNNRNVSGGSLVEMGTRYVIRGVGEFGNLDDLENLIITYKSPGVNQQESYKRSPVYLREVAEVNFVLSEAENIVRLNGKRALAIEIFKEARFNTIDASQAVNEQLRKIQKSLPGYKIQIIKDQASFIRSSVEEVEQTGLIGILLAVLVLFVFLRRIGVTAVISFAIPISIVATFNLMFFNGLTLNIMTLGGLALGAGMLVDNAIVVVENIFRHLESGKPISEAAVLGVGEVGGAITSSTLTTIIVFLPIVYLHGAAGELFKEQAWTVAFSLISSLFVALFVIPMLASKFLKKKQQQVNPKSLSFPGYKKLLSFTLSKRKTVILGSIILVIITILAIPFVGSEFMPAADQADIYIEITLPEGTSLERTEGVIKNIETQISQNFGEYISDIFSKVGPGGASTDELDALKDENNAVIHLNLQTDSKISIGTLAGGLDEIISDIPDAETKLILQQTALQMTLGTTSAPVAIEVKGENLDELQKLCDSIIARISPIEELANIESSFQKGRPEINIEIDHTVASQFSLDASTIGTTVRDLLSGRDAGQMEYQGDYSDLVLRRADMSISELERILIETNTGQRVRLDEVARLTFSNSPREIIRNNQSRIGRVTSQIISDKSFDKISGKVKAAIAGLILPAEYSLSITGEEKLREEAFGNLKFALLLSLILVYMVMAAQFESLLHPFVILLSVPLAGVGTVLLLLIMGMPFNIMSFIGIIMLGGIAVNDSIILVDRINQNRRSGSNLNDAIVAAGSSRIRPIIMTSATTILALLPLTFGFGEGASLRAPMAVAVIGGLVSSTFLTLIVIPSVYHLLAGHKEIRTEFDK